MHSAAWNGHPDVIRLLASHGAKLDAASTVLSIIIEIGLAVLSVIYATCVGCAAGVIAICIFF